MAATGWPPWSLSSWTLYTLGQTGYLAGAFGSVLDGEGLIPGGKV